MAEERGRDVSRWCFILGEVCPRQVSVGAGWIIIKVGHTRPSKDQGPSLEDSKEDRLQHSLDVGQQSALTSVIEEALIYKEKTPERKGGEKVLRYQAQQLRSCKIQRRKKPYKDKNPEPDTSTRGCLEEEKASA